MHGREGTGISGCKVVSLVLAMILVVVLVISYTAYFSLESSYLQLRDEHLQVQEEYMRLKEEYSSIKSDYAELSNSHRQLEDRYVKLLRDYEVLSLEFESLENRLREMEERYRDALGRYSELQDKYAKLEHEYDVLRDEYKALLVNYTGLSMNYTLLLAGLRSIGINTDNIDELWKLGEVMISKTYLIYDYDEGLWKWYFWRQVPITYYLYERTRIIHEPMTLEERVIKYSESLVKEYVHNPIINGIAIFCGMYLEGMGRGLLIMFSKSSIRCHMLRRVMRSLP